MTTATPDTMTEIPDMMIEKTPISFRHEMKHQITLHEDRILSGRLDRLFSHDSHAGTGGCYQVTSLYFDTPDDKALRQKVSGASRREKFRIRYYGEDLSFIRLEKKIKEGGLCAKRSTRLTAEQVELLLGGRIRFLTDSGDPLMIELYSKMKGELLRPVTVVNYEREAFVYSPGNVRVTLDRKLRTGMSAAIIFWKSNMMLSFRSWSGWRCICLTERPVHILSMLCAENMTDKITKRTGGRTYDVSGYI